MWLYGNLWILGFIDDADHGKDNADGQTNLHADQSCGWHGDEPNNGVIPAGTPLRWNILELPQCPPKANNDDASKDTFLESREKRSEEEEDEKDY